MTTFDHIKFAQEIADNLELFNIEPKEKDDLLKELENIMDGRYKEFYKVRRLLSSDNGAEAQRFVDTIKKMQYPATETPVVQSAAMSVTEQPAALTVLKQTEIMPESIIKRVPLDSFELDDLAHGFFSRRSDVIESIKQSMKESGFREDKPLILGRVGGKLFLGDGHTRYFVAKELGLKEVPVVIKECASYEQFLEEIVIGEQVGRRNLTTTDKIRAVQLLLPIETQAAKERQAAGITLASNDAKGGKVSVIIGEKLKISSSTVERIMKILSAENRDIMNRLEREEISITKACDEIISQERAIDVPVIEEQPVPSPEESVIIPEVVDDDPVLSKNPGAAKNAPSESTEQTVHPSEPLHSSVITIPVTLFEFLIEECQDQTKLLSFCQTGSPVAEFIQTYIRMPKISA